MHFEIDYWILPIIFVFTGIIVLGKYFSRHFLAPTLFYSRLESFSINKNLKEKIINFPQVLKYLSLGLFLAALLDPRLQIPKRDTDESPTEGIAIYIVADRSGSMAEKSSIGGSKISSTAPAKIDLLKQITKQFIEGDSALGLPGRPNDLIGLVAFARYPDMLVPLTLDHKADLDALAKIKVASNKEEDGTAIGYAIYKTVSDIAATRYYASEKSKDTKPAYDIKNSIIILVTDGFQEPNPLDAGKRLRNIGIMEAVEYAKSQGVRVYFINVEPAFGSADFEPHRNLFTRAAELTGGKFYMTASGMSLDQIYSAIDKLEKSAISPEMYENIPRDLQPHRYTRFSFYPILIALGLIALIVSVLLETTVIRQIP